MQPEFLHRDNAEKKVKHIDTRKMCLPEEMISSILVFRLEDIRRKGEAGTFINLRLKFYPLRLSERRTRWKQEISGGEGIN